VLLALILVPELTHWLPSYTKEQSGSFTSYPEVADPQKAANTPELPTATIEELSWFDSEDCQLTLSTSDEYFL